MGENKVRLQMNYWHRVALAVLVVGCSNKGTEVPTLPDLSRIIVFESESGKIVKAIREAKDVNVPDNRGATPLMYAAGIQNSKSLRDASKDAVPDDIQILAALIEKGADVNAVTSDGMTTALKVLVFHGRTESIRFLVRNGANPNSINGGMSPLMLASYRCYPDIVEALLKSGADKEISDSSGSTALDHAKSQKCAEAIAMLR